MTLEHFKLPRDDWYDITNWDYEEKEVYAPSKFTIVGNPTITNDGVASGFSSGNYLSVSTDTIPIAVSSQRHELSFKLNSLPSASNVFGIIGNNITVGDLVLGLSSDGKVLIRCSTSNASKNYDIITALNLKSLGDVIGKDLYFTHVWDGTTHTFTITANQVSTVTVNINNSHPLRSLNTIYLGRHNVWLPLDGSIDLKSFSITVDGKKAFKGTETILVKVPPKCEIIGRLYKEALIENFNTIEAKLNELSSLTAYETQIPDFATYDYDDVTLDSESNKVVNLKSFLTIMDLIGVPLDISFSGKICKKISYYDSNMRLHTITNQTIEDLGVDGKVYVVLDTSNDTVYATADATDLSGKFLIGIYENGTIYNVNSKNLLDINILTHLCDMSIETRNFGTIPRDMIPNNLTINNRAVGAWGRESGGAWASDVILSDVGRISK